MIGLPALKDRARVLAGGLLLTAATAIAAIAAPAASAAPLAPAAPLSSAAPSSGGHAIAVKLPRGGSPSGGIEFSAVGATPKGADGRYQFAYTDIKPGSVIKDWIELFNRGTTPAAFGVYPVDATGTTLTGTLVFDQPSQKPTDIGTWVTLYASSAQPHAKQSSFVMGGGSGVIEPFTITVPDNATPGDHTGGLAVQVGVPRVNSKGQRVTVYSRIALPIELRVTGPLREGMQVQSISTSFNDSINPFGPGSASVSYSVANTGNVRISGTALLKVTGLFASSSGTAPKLPTILPGDSVRVTTTVGGLYPAGSFTAKVTVTPSWPPSSAKTALTLTGAAGSASLFAFPWALVGFIILLVGLGYGTWRFLRWRTRQRAAEMAAVAAAARKDAERRAPGKAAAPAASAAKATGTTTTTGDAAPDSQGQAE